LIIAWANGAEIEFKYPNSDCWDMAKTPNWREDLEYRIKPQEDPYKELREAYLNGKTIQMRSVSGNWRDIPDPAFKADVKKYRIKPEIKLVPFTWEDREQLRDKWVKFKTQN